LTSHASIPHRVTTTVITLVVPVILLAVATLVALSWADELPDPVAVHWGSDGADGFGSLASAVLPAVVIGMVTTLGMWALAFYAGHAASTRRNAAGASVGMAAFLSTIMLGSLAGQRGLDDAAQASGIGGTLVVAIVAGVALGVLAALLTPADVRQPAEVRVDAAAPRLDLAATERAVWRRSVFSRPTLTAGILAVLVLLVLTVLTRTWALGLVALLLAGALLCTIAFDTTVDERGFVARGLLGWPTVRVPLDEVVVARATTVSPVKDFGGWGYRLGRGGRTGIVLRTGEALEVQRTGDRVVVVTVDDAATGAALLNTLADRARAS
jgi:MFS family permease